MPKIVDHDERRTAIVRAAWRLIAQVGIQNATLERISAEVGFSNGAVKPYFPTKDDLLTSAFRFVFSETNARMASATEGLHGLVALRAFCMEILPTDDIKVSEARVVIPFWQHALNDPANAGIHEEAMQQWRDAMARFLGEAGDAGEIDRAIDARIVVGQLMNMLLGAQITTVLTPAQQQPSTLAPQLDAFLASLRIPALQP